MLQTPSNTIGERFSEVIDALKKFKKIKTQGEIAQQTGYGPSTITEIKEGRQEPSEKILNFLKEKYGIDPDFITIGNGQMFIGENKSPGHNDQDLKAVNEFLLKKTAELENKLKDQDKILKEFEQIKNSLHELKHDSLNVAAMMFAFQEYWLEHQLLKTGSPDQVKQEIFERALSYLSNFEKEGIHVG